MPVWYPGGERNASRRSETYLTVLVFEPLANVEFPTRMLYIGLRTLSRNSRATPASHGGRFAKSAAAEAALALASSNEHVRCGVLMRMHQGNHSVTRVPGVSARLTSSMRPARVPLTCKAATRRAK
jgi:hypothetical protein